MNDEEVYSEIGHKDADVGATMHKNNQRRKYGMSTILQKRKTGDKRKIRKEPVNTNPFHLLSNYKARTKIYYISR